MKKAKSEVEDLKKQKIKASQEKEKLLRKKNDKIKFYTHDK